MDYSLRELECFTAVAEELSFSRAAKRLHLAQPPLSRHVRVLEEKLGAQLFERGPRAVSLTVAGVRFYEETRGILAQLSRAGDIARRAARGEVDRLRLGIVSAVHQFQLVEVFRQFRESHPGIQLLLQDLLPSEQLRAMASGKLDGGFVGMIPPHPSPHVQFSKWKKENVMAVLPSGHPLEGKRQLSLKELKDESFVAISHAAAPAFASLVQEICRKAGFRPRIILESPRAQAVAVMVAAGSGVALLPESAAEFMGSAVVAKPVKEAPVITHVFAHPVGRSNETMKALLKLLR